MMWARILHSNKQILEMFCLIASLPLVFLNIELHMQSYYPKYSSRAVLVNYRKVRDSAFERLVNDSQAEVNPSLMPVNLSQQEIDDEEEITLAPAHKQEDLFDQAYRELFEKDLSDRSQLVQQVCQGNIESLRWREDDLMTHMKHNDLWDVVHRIVYCPIAKVASTTWFLNFLHMAGIEADQIKGVVENMGNLNRTDNWKGEKGGMGVRALTRHIYEPPPVDNLTELQTIFGKNEGFLVVRHPFVRLVSAYEDKMLNPHPFPYKYHHMIQEKIKHRRVNKKKKIAFPKDLLKSKKYQLMLSRNIINLAQLRSQPSFQEFVDWLIRDRHSKEDTPHSWAKDNTWTPFYTVCPVCDLNYSILKLDAEADEFKQFIEQRSLPMKSTTAIHAVGGKRSSVNKASRYFEKLTKDQIEKLADIYKYDFQMFGYDYKDYLEIANGKDLVTKPPVKKNVKQQQIQKKKLEKKKKIQEKKKKNKKIHETKKKNAERLAAKKRRKPDLNIKVGYSPLKG